MKFKLHFIKNYNNFHKFIEYFSLYQKYLFCFYF